MRAASALLRPGGTVVVIQRADALEPLLAACAGRFGALELIPVYPKAEATAHRIILRGVKGSRAPIRIGPPLVVHENDGAFTARAAALHRGAELL